MSLKERDRLAMLSRVRDGQMSLVESARRLGISYRQAKRLWRRFVAEGDGGLVHRLRGRPGNNRRVADDRRERALGLYRRRYAGFGPTLAAEQMAERDGLAVDHETLRGWLMAAGLWRARRDQRRRHPRRPRRACFGELVQLDGSDHPWLGPGQPRCTLMVMIDDATGHTYARFFESETVWAAMTVFRGWVMRHGLPRALYPDRHGIHRRNDKGADEIEHRTGRRPLTQFGRAMSELGVELICAHSPQAKGRVERANGVLQDRLVKLLALEGHTTIEAANAYLEQAFLPRHNARFAVVAAQEHDAHRPAPTERGLDAVLSRQEQRTVGRDRVVRWLGRWFEIVDAEVTPRRTRKVMVREHLDGRIELVAGGRVLRHKELKTRPARPVRAKPSAADRVAPHAAPWKPAGDHPWRQPLAGAGSAPGRGCAPPLRSASPREKRGTLLPG